MKNAHRKKTQTGLVTLVVLGLLNLSQSAHAGILTTTFASNNSQNGNMFDLTTFNNSLRVTGLDINVSSFSSPGTLEVYTRAGSYQGFESDASAWSLVSSNTLNAVNAINTPTFVDVSDFLLSDNSVTGLYVTFTESTDDLAYTNGSSTFSNSDLRLDSGVGKEYPFGATFSPRTWNGSIRYDVVSAVTAPVPEPGTMSLMALGLTSLVGAARRRKKKEEAGLDRLSKELETV